MPGGTATYAKIAAARMADVPVVMIDRPTAPPSPIVSDVGGSYCVAGKPARLKSVAFSARAQYMDVIGIVKR